MTDPVKMISYLHSVHQITTFISLLNQ